jgi:predicted dehydrogenase
MKRPLHRRDFLKASAILAAGVALPAFSSCTTTKARAPRRPAPGERINVGIVGFGTIAHDTIFNFLGDPRVQVVAVADPVAELGNYGYQGERRGGRLVGQRVVDGYYTEQAKGTFTGCRVYEDFRDMFAREDLDAIVINTPDHWHCAIAVLAARRGLHIYGQKPLAMTIGEGRRIANAVRQHGIVWQTGSQQRSSVYFRTAAEFVRNGRLGRLTGIKVGLPGGHNDWSKLAHRKEPEKVPEGVNYDLWLGPAPERPYIPALFQLNWRHNFAFSGGMITDWGAHHVDIVQWALDMDRSGPVRLEIRDAVLPPENAVYNTVTDYDFDVIYASGLRMNVSSRQEIGIRFEGEDGRSLFVSRDSLVTTPEDLRRQRIQDGEIRLFESRLHERNFIDGIYGAAEPIAPIEVGHRSITISHLANMAIRTGASALDWDPVAERVIGNDKANALMHQPMRARYKV